MGPRVAGAARLFGVFRRGMKGWPAVCLALVACAFVGGASPVASEEYSAYADEKKPVISYLLSEEENVEEFQRKFGLSDAEVEEAQAAVRRENEAVAGEYAESERLVEANKDLPDAGVRKKVAASDFDERITEAVASTKDTVKGVLPQDRSDELAGWVDAQWRSEVREAETEPAQKAGTADKARRGITCRVYATQYRGFTNYEVALPHRRIKFEGGYRVRLSRQNGGSTIAPPVREVGPWNTYDNYWNGRRYRTMWKDLPRCRPEAQAAFFQNYNRGRDEYGREVLNPAGIDLTPAVARRLNFRLYQNGWVFVYMPWARP
jgi:hypothetical protein